MVLTSSSKEPAGTAFMSTVTVSNMVVAATGSSSHTYLSVLVTVGTQV